MWNASIVLGKAIKKASVQGLDKSEWYGWFGKPTKLALCGGTGDGSGPTFVMKHKVNLMKKTTSGSEEVWYIDPRASNHMTNQ